MDNLQTTINEMIQKLDSAPDAETANHIGNALSSLAKGLRQLRGAYPKSIGNEYGEGAAFEADLEDLEALCAAQAKRADRIADEIEDEQREESIYGTYEQQVRQTYYSSVM